MGKNRSVLAGGILAKKGRSFIESYSIQEM